MDPDFVQSSSRESLADLASARVAVLGAGSVGGLAAWCLASAGIRALDLADRDILHSNNLRRHVCGKANLGWDKPKAVADFLQDRFPRVQVQTHCLDFLESPATLRELIAAVNILLVAIDQEGPKHLIDAMCRELSRPAVYAGVYGGGWGAEIILVDPARQAPCYACAARTMGRAGIPCFRQENLPAYALPPIAGQTEAWSQADLCSIMPTAALAARITLAWLMAFRGQASLLHEFTHGQTTCWRIAFRQVHELDLEPWRLTPVAVEEAPGCPACGCETFPVSGEFLGPLLKGLAP